MAAVQVAAVAAMAVAFGLSFFSAGPTSGVVRVITRAARVTPTRVVCRCALVSRMCSSGARGLRMATSSTHHGNHLPPSTRPIECGEQIPVPHATLRNPRGTSKGRPLVIRVLLLSTGTRTSMSIYIYVALLSRRYDMTNIL